MIFARHFALFRLLFRAFPSPFPCFFFGLLLSLHPRSSANSPTEAQNMTEASHRFLNVQAARVALRELYPLLLEKEQYLLSGLVRTL